MSRFSISRSCLSAVALAVLLVGSGQARAAGGQPPAAPPAAAPTPAPAAPAAPGGQAGGVNCDTAESDADLLVCAKRDLAQGDAQLATLSKRIEGTLPAAAKPLFIQAQKAWVAYRDSDCAWNAYDLESGKNIELVLMTCLADLTASRVEELEAGLGAQ